MSIAAPPAELELPSPKVERPILCDARNLTRGLTKSRYGKQILLLGIGVFVVLITLMVGQVRLNTWQGAFF